MTRKGLETRLQYLVGTISCVVYLCFVSDEKNVLNVLHKAGVSDEDWYQLGCNLVTKTADLRAIRASYCDAGNCMIDMVDQWLRSDLNASWENLAKALDNVTGCKEAAAKVRQNTGAGKASNYW